MGATDAAWQFVGEAVVLIASIYCVGWLVNQIMTPTPKAEREYRRAVAQEKFDTQARRDEADRQMQKENRAAVGRWLRRKIIGR